MQAAGCFPSVAASGRRSVWLGRRPAVLSKPASELLRGTGSAINHGRADLQAADLPRIFRPTVPVIFGHSHIPLDQVCDGIRILIPDRLPTAAGSPPAPSAC